MNIPLPQLGVLGILPSNYVLSVWVLQRLMGVVYLVAFLSLAVQIKGLAGHNGIMPATAVLSEVRLLSRFRRFLEHPTLCWAYLADGFLQFLCWSGAALSILFILGFAPVPVSLTLWTFYLSLFTVCPLFLGYQWDILLLETGFLTILVSPWTWWDRWPPTTAPPPIMLVLLWLLLFRLIFSSGWIKLRSGDAAWRSFTALQFHYETQPLPNRLSWYAHHLPAWFHRMSVILMFVIELGTPLLIFAPAPWCYVAGAAIITLMLLIAFTGSYGFFNLLTAVLCVLVFDDRAWQRFLHFFGFAWRNPGAQPCAWPAWLLALVTVLILILALDRLVVLFWPRFRRPRWYSKAHEWSGPFALVNNYGLFAVMTTRRLEIVIEGSIDGSTWHAYEFHWKPGGLNRPPGNPAPHQPRLDWQMWFAALAPLYASPWFYDLVGRLLQGRSEVLFLLRHNPFPDHPPRFVRALLFDYRFSDGATRRKTGAWWQRTLRGVYCPTISLQSAEQHQPASVGTHS